MRYKMIQLVMLLCCLVAYSLSAQTDYAVLAKGDTLYGTVKLLPYGNEQKIQVTGANDKKAVYSKLQVKAFKQDDNVYHTIRTEQGYSIMKLLKQGYLSLYAFQLENQSTWDGHYLFKRDGSGMEISGLLFKKRMKNFLTECKEVVAKIESGELMRNDLDEIIDQFNTCIDEQTESAKRQTARSSKLVELEQAVRVLPESENRTTALDVIAELRLKVERKEKVPVFLAKSLLDSLTGHPQLIGMAEAALLELDQ